jgi:hypothetical protein
MMRINCIIIVPGTDLLLCHSVRERATWWFAAKCVNSLPSLGWAPQQAEVVYASDAVRSSYGSCVASPVMIWGCWEAAEDSEAKSLI